MNGPVTFAFSVERIVMSSVRFCAGTEQATTLEVAFVTGRNSHRPTSKVKKFTKILFVPEEGAAVKVRVVPSGTV